MVTQNLTRIDDVLIRLGWILVVISVVTGFGILDTARRDLSYGLLPILMLIPSTAMLLLGYLIRRRETRTVELGRFLMKHRTVPLRDVQEMTGFSKRQLRDAVNVLNRKAAVGVRVDEGRNMIVPISAEPEARISHAQQCGSCGASVTVDVTADSAATDLTCPYCNGALDGKALRDAQRFVFAPQSPEPAPAQSGSKPLAMPRVKARKPFRLGWFIFLFMFCWPAALIYAFLKARSAPIRFD